MNWRKIILFLIIAFSISWLTAAIIYFSGLEFGTSISTTLIALFYMTAPAIGTVVIQKVIYKQRLSEYGWVWKEIKWKWIFVTIAIAILFVLGTFGATALFGNELGIIEIGLVDFSQENFNAKIIKMLNEAMLNSDINLKIDFESQLKENLISPYLALVGIFIAGIIAAFSINLPFMFGEEFGWRGLLLKETQQMGFLKSNLFIGFFWGIWHAPLILMGHNYPEHPIIGVFMMVLFTTVLSYIFAYCRLKAKSILAPCLLHGMINGTAGGVLFFINGGHPLVSGITGLIGVSVIVLIILTILLFDRNFVKNYKSL